MKTNSHVAEVPNERFRVIHKRGLSEPIAFSRNAVADTVPESGLTELLKLLGLGEAATLDEMTAAVNAGNRAAVARLLGIPETSPQSKVTGGIREKLDPTSFALRRDPYLRRIDEVAVAKGVSKLEALRMVRRDEPALFEAFKRDGQTASAAAEYARRHATGAPAKKHPYLLAIETVAATRRISRRDAMRAVRNEQPELFDRYTAGT